MTLRRSCCPLLAAELAMGLVAGLPALAASNPLPPPPAPGDAASNASGTEERYLDVSVNRTANPTLQRFVVSGQMLSTSHATLRALGLRVPADTPVVAGLIALRDLPGIDITYDPLNQRLALLVPAAMLERPITRIDLSVPNVPPPPAPGTPGALLSYDIHAQQAPGYRGIAGVTELRLSGLGSVTWSNTMSSRFDDDKGGRSFHNTRLDSQWQWDLPERMLSLTVGDVITGSLDWSRAIRIGGLHLSRDFSLQPYRITTPLASFAGEVVLPSTVDLYIDGIHQASQQVLPGRFQLDSTPSINGAGRAQLQFTDINGQRRLLDFALYGTPQLLQAGLFDGALDIGVMRRDYGLRSFSYDHTPLLSASLRRGMTRHLTVEAHAEASSALRLAGIGLITLLGENGGIVNASLAGSHASMLHGHQYALGYQWNSSGFTLSTSTLRHSIGFRDAAAVLAQSALPRRTDQLFLGFGNRRGGQISLSYLSQDYPGTPRVRLAGLGWSLALPHQAWLNVQLNREFGNRRDDNALVYFSTPLDRLTQASASLQHRQEGDVLSLQASRSLPGDQDGWGWRAQASGGIRRSAAIEVSRLGPWGLWRAGIDDGDSGGATTYADASGSLVWLGTGMHALRRVDDAFALVSTNGVPGVPVKLENRLVGTTDAQGQLFVTPLRSWQRNRISIDALALPVDMLLDSPQQDIVPAARSGTLVDFSLRRSRALYLQVRDADGRPLPVGSTVAIAPQDGPTASTTLVGHDGMVYLRDPPAGAHLRIQHDGSQCIATLPAPSSDDSSITRLALTCR